MPRQADMMLLPSRCTHGTAWGTCLGASSWAPQHCTFRCTTTGEAGLTVLTPRHSQLPPSASAAHLPRIGSPGPRPRQSGWPGHRTQSGRRAKRARSGTAAPRRLRTSGAPRRCGRHGTPPPGPAARGGNRSPGGVSGRGAGECRRGAALQAQPCRRCATRWRRAASQRHSARRTLALMSCDASGCMLLPSRRVTCTGGVQGGVSLAGRQTADRRGHRKQQHAAQGRRADLLHSVTAGRAAPMLLQPTCGGRLLGASVNGLRHRRASPQSAPG